MTGQRLVLLALLGAAGLLTGLAPEARADVAPRELRVCADPNNLPFSNQQGQGFENRIAELVARELDARLSYTWWAQRRGFIRNTLNAGACDLVIGVPAGYELVETTAPYYRSAYVFVYRADRGLDLHAMRDPRLRQLRIGVHLVGDDGANPPPADALGQQGIVDNVVGYMIYGDYRAPRPTARIIDAVAAGEIDVAAVWGPIGGYFARHAAVPLVAVPITDTEAFAPLPFQFGVAMGVRKGDHHLREELDEVLARRRADIDALLDQYGVPRVEGTGATPGGASPEPQRRSAAQTG